MGDEIHLAESGARVGPLREGTDRDLVLEPGAGLGRGEPARRALRAGGRQQPREGRATRLPDELLDRRRHREFPAPDQPLEELAHERMQPVGTDPAAGLPQDFGRGGDGGAVAPRAASA
jgi:hypothetical protein